MASSTSKPFAIYRIQSPGQTEANIDDIEAVGLEIGIDDSFEAGLISYKPVADARRTDVGNPDQVGGHSPDTGNTPILFELDFIVNEKTANSKIMAKMMRWMLEDKDNDNFFGKTGIRYDAKSWMNVEPTSIAGGKIIHFDFLDNITWGGLVNCRALVLSHGNPSAMKNNIQAFLLS